MPPLLSPHERQKATTNCEVEVPLWVAWAPEVRGGEARAIRETDRRQSDSALSRKEEAKPKEQQGVLRVALIQFRSSDWLSKSSPI